MMKRYEKYKNSGIRWIGQIPEHWHVGKIKFLCDAIYAGATPSTSNPAYWEGGTIPWIPSGCCHDCNINEAPKYITEDGLQHSSTKLIPANTTVMALTGATCAQLGYLTFESCANQSVVAFVENKQKTNSRYLFYTLFAARQEILSHQSGGAQGGVNQEDCSNIVIPFISLSEQETIVRFLDDKTSKLDECVRLLELQRTDLSDYCKAIVSETITHGLNLDVRLKESGVNWIGQIPEHWELKPCRHLFDNLDYLRKPITAAQRSRKKPLYDYYGASGVIDRIDFYNVDDKVLLIGEDGANLAMRNLPLVYKAEGKIWVNNHAHILRPIRNNYDYMAYALECADYTAYITGSAQPKLSQANLNNVKLPVPPIEEQLSIVAYLNEKTAKIDEAIKRIDEQITDLCAYRTALISDVVTGKIDVRN